MSLAPHELWGLTWARQSLAQRNERLWTVVPGDAVLQDTGTADLYAVPKRWLVLSRRRKPNGGLRFVLLEEGGVATVKLGTGKFNALWWAPEAP